MFLPIKREEFDGTPDFIYVIGEAYVDHPSFGHAIVSRLIESEGFSVVMIPQPMSDADYTVFGEPRIGFLVSSGVVDSMVNNYTVAKMKRTRDVYSEGGDVGKRPDRAVDVYTRTLKRLYPSSPVIIGGIEASLRRFAHYDYWADEVLPSILVTSGADLLIYGMGERPIKEICSLLRKGVPIEKIRDVRGTCYFDSFSNLSAKLKKDIEEHNAEFCPSYESVKSDKLEYVKAFNIESRMNDPYRAKKLLQKHGGKYVVVNEMQFPMSADELDKIYDLPYERNYHPSYVRGVPAIEEVKYSLTSVRGCFGACNYCAITYHQGRIVQKRSKENIIKEAKLLVRDRDFKGYIHDVGGPTANFRDTACKKQHARGACTDSYCIGYKKCPNLEISHKEYIELLQALREIEGVKKVFIRSGIRFDYVMYDKDESFLRELVKHHVSGQLKVAPEHVSNRVLKAMNKPDFAVYKAFKERFDELNRSIKKKQYLVPYLISSHPGSTLSDAIDLALYLKSIGYMPEQVQDFYPTPSTKSTCMYYTELDPDTLEPIYVAKTKREKMMQRALMQYRKKSNYDIVHEALLLAGRSDLIGFGEGCLIKPTKEEALERNKERGVTKVRTADEYVKKSEAKEKIVRNDKYYEEKAKNKDSFGNKRGKRDGSFSAVKVNLGRNKSGKKKGGNKK